MAKLFYFFTALIIFTGCQSRNQVTHNKRKYRKGYYKPNRAKVKAPKGEHSEEAYALNQKTKEEQSVPQPQQKKAEKEKRTDPEYSLEKEETFTAMPAESQTQDTPEETGAHQKIKDRAPPQVDDDPEDEEKTTSKKKKDWIFWLSVIMWPVGLGMAIAAAIIVLTGLALWLGLVILGLLLAVSIALLYFNIQKLKKLDKTEKNKKPRTGSILFILLYSIGVLLILGLILFLVLIQ